MIAILLAAILVAASGRAFVAHAQDVSATNAPNRPAKPQVAVAVGDSLLGSEYGPRLHAALLFMLSGDHASARSKLAALTNDDSTRPEASFYLGILERNSLKHDAALTYLLQALSAARALEDARWIAKTLANIAITHEIHQSEDSSHDSLEAALKTWNNLEDTLRDDTETSARNVARERGLAIQRALALRRSYRDVRKRIQARVSAQPVAANSNHAQ